MWVGVEVEVFVEVWVAAAVASVSTVVGVNVGVNVAVKVAVAPCGVATTTVIAWNATLSFSLLSTTLLVLSTRMATFWMPSLVNVTGILNSISAFALSGPPEEMLNSLPSGKSIATWKAAASASPLLATLTTKGTVASFCTGSSTTVVPGIVIPVMVRLGSMGVGVIVGVFVTVAVIPGGLVLEGLGVGCAILVWVAKIAVEDRSPADGP